MRLLVLDGSPRGQSSNTRRLLDRFLEGFLETQGHEAEVLTLIRPSEFHRALESFGRADAVLLGFPLYTDAMPGRVKEFIEELGRAIREGDTQRARPVKRPALLFLVQSGFPEATHTAPVARYLEGLARRLGCHCVGVMRRGGVEGIRVQPPSMTKGLFGRFRKLGEGYGRTGTLDPVALRELQGWQRIPWLFLWVSSRMSDLVFWNPQLKANGAYAKRLDQPFAAAVRRTGSS